MTNETRYARGVLVFLKLNTCCRNVTGRSIALRHIGAICCSLVSYSIKSRVGSSRVIYDTELPIVINKFKPIYAKQRLLELR